MTGKHSGAALVLGLTLLASMSLLAISAASGGALQRRMAANWEQRTISFSHAAIADSEARAWLGSRSAIERGDGCGSEVIQPHAISFIGALPDYPEHQGLSWWETHSTSVNQHPELGTELNPGLNLPGRASWLVEEIHCEPANASRPLLVAWYRILSRAGGNWPGSVVVTESIVARPWGDAVQDESFPGRASLATFCAQFPDDIPCGRKSWRQRR